MAKPWAIVFCVLALAAATNPADASPTTKKITLTCSSVAPNVITGTANVTLCAASAPFPCAGATFICATTLACASNGIGANPVATFTCGSAPFKVDAVTGGQTFIDTNGSGGTFFTSTLSKGQFGFSETVGPPPDTATLTVK